MGLISWIKREKQAAKNQPAQPGFQIGGGPLSISRAWQEYKEQATVKLDMAGPYTTPELTEERIIDYLNMGYVALMDGEGGKWLLNPDSPNYQQTLNYIRKHKGGIHAWEDWLE